MKQKISSRFAKRVLLASLVAVIALGATTVAVSGVMDLFFGHGPALQKRMNMGSQGLALREEVRIREYCHYQFELWLHHERMHQLDPLIVDNAFPLAVTVDVFRQEDGRSTPVGRLSEIGRLNGHGAQVTTFLLGGGMRLDKGRYRVELASTGRAPQFDGLEAEFVIQPRPKSTCPKKGNG